MTTSKRKRFSAFDDFPASDAQSQPPAEPAASKVVSMPSPQVERIERLTPSRMLPDRFQPRRLLPSALRADFFAGRIDCYQAAERWLEIARHDNGHKAVVDRLLAMGDSFEDHGQIKPITGSWAPASDGNYVFLIETGERRFWAACLRRVNEKHREEPQLRVEVVSTPTRQRQVLENRHAEAPSAVGQACEIASLILAEMGRTPDSKADDEFEYFRQARSQRMPAGLWERITPIMQLTRPRMVQLLNILQLPSPLLDLADRYRVPERVLREVLSMPADQWEYTLRVSIQNELTSDDVAEIAQAAPAEGKKLPRPASPAQPTRVAISGLRRFGNVLADLDEISREQALDEIADDLVVSGQAEGFVNLMNELAVLIEARLRRR